MNIQIELDDFTDKGLQDLVDLLRKKGQNPDEYFQYDEDGEIEDLTDKGNELFDSVDVEGQEWEEYCKGISPSLDDPGMPAEGGYYNSVRISFYINGDYEDIVDHLRDGTVESIIEKLSEDRLNNY